MLRKVLVAVGNSAEYQASSQKALKAWSDAQSETDPSKQLTPVAGVYPDSVKAAIIDTEWYLCQAEWFLEAVEGTHVLAQAGGLRFTLLGQNLSFLLLGG